VGRAPVSERLTHRKPASAAAPDKQFPTAKFWRLRHLGGTLRRDDDGIDPKMFWEVTARRRDRAEEARRKAMARIDRGDPSSEEARLAGALGRAFGVFRSGTIAWPEPPNAARRPRVRRNPGRRRRSPSGALAPGLPLDLGETLRQVGDDAVASLGRDDLAAEPRSGGELKHRAEPVLLVVVCRAGARVILLGDRDVTGSAGAGAAAPGGRRGGSGTFFVWP
jgi:hypothetical protein